MAANKHTAWRKLLNRAYDMAALAHAYAEDGAFLTAADRLETAAKLFREGHALRNKALGLGETQQGDTDA